MKTAQTRGQSEKQKFYMSCGKMDGWEEARVLRCISYYFFSKVYDNTMVSEK